MNLAASNTIPNSSTFIDECSNKYNDNVPSELLLTQSLRKSIRNKESIESKTKKNITKIGARNKHFNYNSFKKRKVSKESNSGSNLSSMNPKIYQENFDDLSFEDQAIQGLTKYSLYIWNSLIRSKLENKLKRKMHLKKNLVDTELKHENQNNHENYGNHENQEIQENQVIPNKNFQTTSIKDYNSLLMSSNSEKSLKMSEVLMNNQKEPSIKIGEVKNLKKSQSVHSNQNLKNYMKEDNKDKIKNQMESILNSKLGSELMKCLKMTSDEIVKMKTK